MLILNDIAYITEWYINQVRVIDLVTEETIASIPVNGLPEDIITNEGSIFVSINMNSDWSSANLVIKINV